MMRWLPKIAILPTGTPGLMADDHSFFYGKALVIQWGDFCFELTIARSDEVAK